MTKGLQNTSITAFKVSDSLSVWLDMFRWMAALAVAFTHVNNRFFVKILTLPHDERTLEQYLFAAISGFGRPAVMIFFVLSGFLVGGGSLRKYLRDGDFDSSEYVVSRFTRLWTVLIPSFALTYFLNIIGAYVFSGAINGIYRVGGADDTFLHGPVILVCNAFFLQTALCHQYGENGALWTLFNEFWYYIAWPLCMIAIWSSRNLPFRLSAILAALALLITLSSWQFVGANIALYFTIWLLGVAAAASPRVLLPISPLVAAGLFIIYMLAVRILLPTAVAEANPTLQFATDLMLAILFANMLVVMKFAQTLRAPPLPRIHKNLAAFSFSLYCIHTPIINCYGAFLVMVLGTGWQMRPKGAGAMPYAYAFSAVVLVIICAYLFSLITERHTLAIRNLVMGRLRELKQ